MCSENMNMSHPAAARGRRAFVYRRGRAQVGALVAALVARILIQECGLCGSDAAVSARAWVQSWAAWFSSCASR